MASTQLNCRVEVLLAKRLREAATARHTTTGALVAQAIEALLAGNSASPAPPPSALAALEARVERLEAMASLGITKAKNNDESRVDNIKSTDLRYHDNLGKNQSTTQENRIPDHDKVSSQALTTAELAIQTGTNKAAWNTWASKATIGDTRHHPQAGSWRLLGKAAPASGGPERWVWEPAG
jgi:hypothetical protein